MRIAGLLTAVMAMFVSGAALAQDWGEFVSREDFFEINLPGDPMVTPVPYRTAKGTELAARVYTAIAPPDSILAGTYTVTVVDYAKAKDEIGTALDHAGTAIKAKGTAKYDGLNLIDLHVSRRLTVETATTRILAEILVAANDRLYITQAETPLNVPPAANFQASLQILDENGTRIRARTVLGIPAGEAPKLGAGGVVDESDKLAGLMTGAWRNSAGSCEPAYFKSGTRTKSARGAQALTGTIANSGIAIPVQAIINGAREGQIIDPVTDKVVMLFDLKDGGKLSFSPIGAPALGWPDVTLELCPASRG